MQTKGTFLIILDLSRYILSIEPLAGKKGRYFLLNTRQQKINIDFQILNEFLDKYLTTMYAFRKETNNSSRFAKTSKLEKNMDTQKWSLLLKVLDSGSISAAAAQSNYTISGISRMIASLEEEVGFRLLNRNNRGVCPTAECELLLNDVRTLLHDEEQITQRIANISGLQIGTLTIGTAYSSSYPLLTKQIVRFVQQYPHIKIKMLWGYNDELCQAVEEHKMDICVVSKPTPEMLWFIMQREEMVAMVSANSPYADKDRVPLSILKEEPYIDIYPNRDSDSSLLLKRAGIKPNTRFTTSDRYAAHEMVAAGLGITVINQTLTIKRDDIKILPLDPPQELIIGLACLPNPTLSTRRFIGFMQEFIRDSAF